MTEQKEQNQSTHSLKNLVKGINAHHTRSHFRMPETERPKLKPEWSLLRISQTYITEEDSYKFFYDIRWPLGPVCPRCYNNKEEKGFYEEIDKEHDWRKRYRCKKCRHPFSLTSGTFIDNKQATFAQWINAVCYMVMGRGVSALLLSEYIGVHEHTARKMIFKICHLAEQDENFNLGKNVAIDEVYIGGDPRNKPMDIRGAYTNNKVPVVGMIGRTYAEYNEDVEKYIQADSKIFLKVFRDRKGKKITRDEIIPLIAPHIPDNDSSTIVQTDESSIYDGGIFGKRDHKRVDHKKGQYAEKDLWAYSEPDEIYGIVMDWKKMTFTTNDIEGVFGSLKKTLSGIYNSVSPYHLQKYIDIFCFRWNHRHLDVMERMKSLLKNMTNSNIPKDKLKAKKSELGLRSAKENKEYKEQPTEEYQIIMTTILDNLDMQFKKDIGILVERNGVFIVSPRFQPYNVIKYKKLIRVLIKELSDKKYSELKELIANVRKKIKKKKKTDGAKAAAEKQKIKQAEIRASIIHALSLISKEDKETFGITKNGKKSDDFKKYTDYTFYKIIKVLQKHKKLSILRKIMNVGDLVKTEKNA